MQSNNYLGLLKQLVLNDFRLKYRNSIFGYLWTVVSPLIVLMTLYVVFSIVMKINEPNYQIFLLIGIIIWNFFADATTISISSLISKAQIIKKINVPKHIFVLSAILSSGISLLINFAILILMILAFGVGLGMEDLSLVFYMLLLFVLVTGFSLALSGIYVKFQDITHLWSLVIFIGFWLTPIIYSEAAVPLAYRRFYMLNPLARIVNHMRDTIIHDYIANFEQHAITVVMAALVFFLGYMIFKITSTRIAEEI